jgi:hypothetical protein
MPPRPTYTIGPGDRLKVEIVQSDGGRSLLLIGYGVPLAVVVGRSHPPAG